MLTDECVQGATGPDSRVTQAAQLAFAHSSTAGAYSRTLLNAAEAPGSATTDAAATAVPGAGDEGNSVLTVNTAQGFVDAIVAKTAHIVVTEHLKLGDVPEDNADLATIIETGIPSEVLSITVCPPSVTAALSGQSYRSLPRISSSILQPLGHTCCVFVCDKLMPSCCR